MKPLPILISLLLSLCLCTAPAAHAAEDIYNPLEVGLLWTADVLATAPDGKKYEGKASREVTGTKEINGQTYFVTVSTIVGIPGFGSFTSYRRKAADGIRAIRESDPDKVEFLETPFPLTVNQTWEVPATKGKMIFKVDALEAVTVGETKHENCYKISYHSDSSDMSSYYFLAPNIGNVMEHLKIGGGTIVFTHRALVKK